MKKFNFVLRNLCLIVLLSAMAGCGSSVDWFPEYKRSETTPDQFSFPTKTGVALNAEVTSAPITVSGITGTSSPISITGSVGSNSKFTVTGADGVVIPGAVTVKNGDKVTVAHTSANALGTATTSTLTIGTISAIFTSLTQTVATPSFSIPTQVGGFLQAFATISSVDGIPGTHVVSIKDGNAQYALGDTTTIPFAFTTNTQTVTTLNNTHIFLRTPFTAILPATATLTIDGVNFTVTMNTASFTVVIAPT